jgi:hypothetical protein
MSLLSVFDAADADASSVVIMSEGGRRRIVGEEQKKKRRKKLCGSFLATMRRDWRVVPDVMLGNQSTPFESAWFVMYRKK